MKRKTQILSASRLAKLAGQGYKKPFIPDLKDLPDNQPVRKLTRHDVIVQRNGQIRIKDTDEIICTDLHKDPLDDVGGWVSGTMYGATKEDVVAQVLDGYNRKRLSGK